MAQQYWFRAKKHRIGLYPVSWQGWVVMLLYIALNVHSYIEISKVSHSTSDILINFIPRLFIFSALLIVIAYLKGEPSAKPSTEKSEASE